MSARTSRGEVQEEIRERFREEKRRSALRRGREGRGGILKDLLVAALGLAGGLISLRPRADAEGGAAR